MVDNILAKEQYNKGLANHASSAKSKAPTGKCAIPASLSPGDLVYIKGDGTKHCARDRYIVTQCTHDYLFIYLFQT